MDKKKFYKTSSKTLQEDLICDLLSLFAIVIVRSLTNYIEFFGLYRILYNFNIINSDVSFLATLTIGDDNSNLVSDIF